LKIFEHLILSKLILIYFNKKQESVRPRWPYDMRPLFTLERLASENPK